MSARIDPVCARLMRRDPDLADRMWAGGRGADGAPVDRVARREAVRLCEACPVRLSCLASGLPVIGRRGNTAIVAGLTTPARACLQQLVADGLHADADLCGVDSGRVEGWLRAHPDALDQARMESRSRWSRMKRRWRSKARVTAHTPIPVCASRAVQGELDLGLT